jgi:hypothetical protein
MPTLKHVYLQLVMIIFLDCNGRLEKVAGRYVTVLYNYVHNMCFCRYGFYLHWVIFTQLARWGKEQLNSPLSMRERVRMGGKRWIYVHCCPLIRPSATFSFRPFGSLGRRVERKTALIR